MEKLKQSKKLFIKLIKEEKSVFYAAGRINKTLLNKTRQSFYKEDKIFYKFYLELENKNILYENDKDSKTRIPFYTPFVEQKKDIDHSSALYSIKMPFEPAHPDIADIHFFSKSAVDPKYCLLVVDLFTSKVYVYTMKSRNLLSKKLELFYRDIQQKREQIAEKATIRLQTDLEFAQNEIKKKKMLKCLIVVSEVIKLMLLSRKLENLKNFLKVNVYIEQHRINVLIQEN